MENKEKGIRKYLVGIFCLVIVVGIFGGIGSVMGLPNMLNTIMKTAHDLLLNTVFYLMAICVITGALGRIFVERKCYRLVPFRTLRKRPQALTELLLSSSEPYLPPESSTHKCINYKIAEIEHYSNR